MRIIKKYNNRKLYDTKLKRYTTLPEIAELIRMGIELEVVNAQDKDVTNETLKQAITKLNIDNRTLSDIIYNSELK